MGQLANHIDDTATQLVPPVPAGTSQQLLTGPGLLMIVGAISAAVAALEQIAAGASIHVESRAPGAGDGAPGDSWLNATTGDLFKNTAGAWQPAGNLRGGDGKTPRKGVDYFDGRTPQKGVDYSDGKDGYTPRKGVDYRDGKDGDPGADGSHIFDYSYAPTPADDAGTGKEGDMWYHTISPTSYARYYKQNGAWRLRFTSPASTSTTTPATNTPPAVTVSLPAGTTAVAGSNVQLQAVATDSDGIASLVVQAKNLSTGAVTIIGSAATGSYAPIWQAVVQGTYSITATATDTKGLANDSAPVLLTVQAATVPAPTISSIAPATGPVGTQVTISGANFGSTQNSSTVNFNGLTATIISWAAAAIVALVPTGCQTGPVSVVTPAGTATGPTYTVTAPTNAQVLVPALGNYWYNAGIERTNSAGQKVHAAGAMLTVDLQGSPSLTLTAFSTGGPILLVDKGTGSLYPVNGLSSSEQDFTLSGLSGGTVNIYLGSNQRTYDVGDVQGSDVTKITFPSGRAGRFTNPTQSAIAGCQINDSIGVGSGSSSPFTKGYAALLRNANRSLTWLGYGSGQLYVALDPANRPQLWGQIHASIDGAAKKFVLCESGSNDALGANGGGAAPLADIMSRFTQFLADFPVEFPGVPLIVMSPINRDGEGTANQYGWTMQQLRDAQASACAGKSFVTFIDGANIILPADRADFAHPNDTGHLKIFNALDPSISAVTGASTPPPAFSTTSGFAIWQTSTGEGADGGAQVDANNSKRLYKTSQANTFGGTAFANTLASVTPGSTVQWQYVVQAKAGAGGTQLVTVSADLALTHYTAGLVTIYWNGSNYKVFFGSGEVFSATLSSDVTLQIVATDKIRVYRVSSTAATLIATTTTATPAADVCLFAEMGGTPVNGQPEIIGVQWFPANPQPRGGSATPGTGTTGTETLSYGVIQNYTYDAGANSLTATGAGTDWNRYATATRKIVGSQLVGTVLTLPGLVRRPAGDTAGQFIAFATNKLAAGITNAIPLTKYMLYIDGGTLRLFVNGSYVRDVAWLTAPGGTTDLSISIESDGVHFYDGGLAAANQVDFIADSPAVDLYLVAGAGAAGLVTTGLRVYSTGLINA